MALNDDIAEGIATIREELLSTMPLVTHRAWRGQTYDGVASYKNTQYHAIVEDKQKIVRTFSGTEEVSNHYIGILEPITPVAATSPHVRTNPVDVNDRFILPSGLEVSVMAVDGFINAGTGLPYYSQVYCG